MKHWCKFCGGLMVPWAWFNRCKRCHRNGLAVALVLLLTGCSTLKRPEELTWQGLRLVDTIATMQAMRDPCVQEGHPLTRAVIGEHPSGGEILLWGAGGALVHLGISDLLLNAGWKKTYTVWQTISIIDTAYSAGDSISVAMSTNRRKSPRVCDANPPKKIPGTPEGDTRR
jgi:hypothetical protein